MFGNTYVFAISQLRSHHEHLIQANEDDTDNPLMLKTTAKWKREETSLWEIVWEIVAMTLNVANPFALDTNYISSLPVEESILLSGALTDFLQTVWLQAEPSVPFVNDVYTDIKWLQERHLEMISEFSAKSIKMKEIASSSNVY
ncbi:hypothetical protein EC973_001557 [Apophysomyces ossiformis]|uniref:DUF7886 domain-containing protein n=1 Tax=Apophysomyces ossiformis TaxID=679940 RepID=A0A8H7ERS1_9FUNG|nr:hypothetical protein EC973_001557 [Apophysomyces ossiformis]